MNPSLQRNANYMKDTYLQFQDSLEDAIQHARNRVTEPIRNALHDLVTHQADAIAESFYAAANRHPEAHVLLGRGEVPERLRRAMSHWLSTLFDPAQPARSLLDLQERTGAAHARMGVSNRLVSAGARHIKSALTQVAHQHLDRGDLASAIQHVYEMVDLARDAMVGIAESNGKRLQRAEESLRLFQLSHNLRTERERQQRQLLQWGQQLQMHHYWLLEPSSTALPAADEGIPEHGDPFTLWVRHKAPMLFGSSVELSDIQQAIAAIELSTVPRLRAARLAGAEAGALMFNLQQQLDGIGRLLTHLFDRAGEVEDGLDQVTRLLNRRFFPTVAKREIGLAHQAAQGLALLAIEIQRFDMVRTTLGDAMADLVLAQLAQQISDLVRAGDYVFRYGDAQFLLLLTEVGEAHAQDISSALLRRLTQAPLRLGNQIVPVLQIVAGLAIHDGHPDYQRLLDRAHDALAEARTQYEREPAHMGSPVLGDPLYLVRSH
jgi:diguanylate cyclase